MGSSSVLVMAVDALERDLPEPNRFYSTYSPRKFTGSSEKRKVSRIDIGESTSLCELQIL
jgi:hypothetical protein